MTRKRKQYSKQEKLEIVKLSLSEAHTVVGLSKRFNVSTNSIYNWRSKYAKYQENAFSGKGIKTQTEEQRRIS